MSTSGPVAPADVARSTTSMWAPLSNSVFRALWLAGLASNIGTWMQTVGAQWLLVDKPNASTLVALVQTAMLLPTILLALPSGVLADSFDRRALLIGVQAYQAVVAGVLAALTAAGEMPPALLLVLTFALGCGATLAIPAYQALIPELVPRRQLATASALGAVNMNLARAVGPALAGVVVAQWGPAAVFALNALSFAAFAAVLLLAKVPESEPVELPERFGMALRAGGRYVRHSHVVRRILLRSALFVLPASSLWALLPLVASRRLGLGAGGYGALLAALGLGAVAGAFMLPHVRARITTSRMVGLASLAYLGALVALALVRQPLIVGLALVPAGMAWLAVLSSLNASMQLFLPGWVRARGLSIYQIVFQGGQALGAVVWGLVAQRTGLVTTFLLAALLMGLSAASIARWPLIDAGHWNREPAMFWPDPILAFTPELDVGPVLITSIYTVPPDRQERFLHAMDRVRRVRLRTGATRWSLFRSGEEPDQFLEVYAVPSWAEHLRQHGGRLTGTDQEFEEEAKKLSDPPPVTSHYFPTDATHETP